MFPIVSSNTMTRFWDCRGVRRFAMARRISIAFASVLISATVYAQDDITHAQLGLMLALADVSRVQVTPDEDRILRRTQEAFIAGEPGKALESWTKFVVSRSLRDTPTDFDAIIAFVLREPFLSTDIELRLAAERAHYFNQQRKKLGALLEEARSCRWAQCASDGAVRGLIEKWKQEQQAMDEQARTEREIIETIMATKNKVVEALVRMMQAYHGARLKLLDASLG
jgi:hypothetical protein